MADHGAEDRSVSGSDGEYDHRDFPQPDEWLSWVLKSAESLLSKLHELKPEEQWPAPTESVPLVDQPQDLPFIFDDFCKRVIGIVQQSGESVKAELNDVDHLQTFCQQFSSYVRSELSDIQLKLVSDVVRDSSLSWLLNMFGWDHTHKGYYYGDSASARAKCLLSAILKKQKETTAPADGVALIYDFERSKSSFVIYVSEWLTLDEHSEEVLNFFLAAANAIIRRVPSESRGMNGEELRKVVEADREAGLIPCAVWCNICFGEFASFDDVHSIAAVAGEFNLWMHVEGEGLLTLWMKTEHKSALAAACDEAMSMLMPVHSFPGGEQCNGSFVAFHKSNSSTEKSPCPSTTMCLDLFPFYVYMQRFGAQAYIATVTAPVEVVSHFGKVLASFDAESIVVSEGDARLTHSVDALPTELPGVNSGVCQLHFWYQPHLHATEQCSAAQLAKLNHRLWTGDLEVIGRNAGIVPPRKAGNDFQFTFSTFPFEDFAELASEFEVEEIRHFCQLFKDQVEREDVCLSLQQHVRDAANNDHPSSEEIKPVPFDEHATLQSADHDEYAVVAFRYVPAMIARSESANSKALNLLNEELLHTMREKEMYSSGKIRTLPCGKKVIAWSCSRQSEELPSEKDIDNFVDALRQAAKQLDDSGKVLSIVSQCVEAGIKKANERLEHELESEFEHDGILRHLPGIGSVLSYWAPIDRVQKKGFKYDLGNEEEEGSNSNSSSE